LKWVHIEARYAGDFGNLIADGSGKAHLERTDTVISIGGGNSVIGRGIIICGAADDMTAQPTGQGFAKGGHT
jgi:Cu-Zn family superoxide dismutase